MSSKHILTTPIKQRSELSTERSLRPTDLNSYIGQPLVKETITVIVESTKIKGGSAGHIILYGPPGLGKTTLAHIIAAELKVPIKTSSGPALERAGDLVAVLTNLRPGSIFFIDEIHRLRRPLEEILYPAMEDGRIDLILGKGPGAKTVQLNLSPFTLIGATTRFGSLSSPLRDRFNTHLHLDFYNEKDLAAILKVSAQRMGIEIGDHALKMIAARSRRTPRIANRLLRQAGDYALAKTGQMTVEEKIVTAALNLLEIDEMGLNSLDRRYLSLLLNQFSGQPTGVTTISAALREERETIEDVIEPYLMQIGFLQRTPAGRVPTGRAAQHFGLGGTGQATLLP